MIFNLNVTNEKGESRNLTDSNEMIVEYSGLAYARADLAVDTSIDGIGVNVGSVRYSAKNITLNCYINHNVDYWRKEINKYFKVGEYSRLVFSSKNDEPKEISGIVETINSNRFDRPTKGRLLIQVILYCPFPFYRKETAAESTTIRPITEREPIGYLFAAGKDIGDLPTGFTVRVAPIMVNGSVDLSVELALYGEKLAVENVHFGSGDYLLIDTESKEIKLYNFRNKSTDLLSLWKRGNKWLQLKPERVGTYIDVKITKLSEPVEYDGTEATLYLKGRFSHVIE